MVQQGQMARRIRCAFGKCWHSRQGRPDGQSAHGETSANAPIHVDIRWRMSSARVILSPLVLATAWCLPSGLPTSKGSPVASARQRTKTVTPCLEQASSPARFWIASRRLWRYRHLLVNTTRLRPGQLPGADGHLTSGMADAIPWPMTHVDRLRKTTRSCQTLTTRPLIEIRDTR